MSSQNSQYQTPHGASQQAGPLVIDLPSDDEEEEVMEEEAEGYPEHDVSTTTSTALNSGAHNYRNPRFAGTTEPIVIDLPDEGELDQVGPDVQGEEEEEDIYPEDSVLTTGNHPEQYNGTSVGRRNQEAVKHNHQIDNGGYNPDERKPPRAQVEGERPETNGVQRNENQGNTYANSISQSDTTNEERRSPPVSTIIIPDPEISTQGYPSHNSEEEAEPEDPEQKEGTVVYHNGSRTHLERDAGSEQAVVARTAGDIVPSAIPPQPDRGGVLPTYLTDSMKYVKGPAIGPTSADSSREAPSPPPRTHTDFNSISNGSEQGQKPQGIDHHEGTQQSTDKSKNISSVTLNMDDRAGGKKGTASSTIQDRRIEQLRQQSPPLSAADPFDPLKRDVDDDENTLSFRVYKPNTRDHRRTDLRNMAVCVCLLVILIAGIVGGVCGSGKCGGSDNEKGTSSSTSSSNAANDENANATSFVPTGIPGTIPSSYPSPMPSLRPIGASDTWTPTNLATTSVVITDAPSAVTAKGPTVGPSLRPTSRPTVLPATSRPTVRPTIVENTAEPSARPTSSQPTIAPTTQEPTIAPVTSLPAVPPSTPRPQQASTASSSSPQPTDDSPFKNPIVTTLLRPTTAGGESSSSSSTSTSGTTTTSAPQTPTTRVPVMIPVAPSVVTTPSPTRTPTTPRPISIGIPIGV